jgi:hypothetical protein
MPIATLKDGRQLEYLPEQIGEGTMKRVHLTADRQSVVCFYKDQKREAGTNRMTRLDAILGRCNVTRDPRFGEHFGQVFCWPTAIVVGPELGIVTPAYPPRFFFGSGPFAGREKEGRWFSSARLRARLPLEERGNLLNYLQLCNQMARAVRKMHMMGLAHSDLSNKNVLLDPPSGNCLVIDIDSLVVPGVFPPDVIGTSGYIAPEVLATHRLPLNDPQRKLPSNLTDLHALAVLIYEYLLQRHPLRGPKVNSCVSAEEDELLSLGERALFIEDRHDSSNHWTEGLKISCDSLGPHLSELFHRAFEEGLHDSPKRPTAMDWEKALARTSDLLIPCGNKDCPNCWFVYDGSKSPTCPRCDWRLGSPLPVLEFYQSSRRGRYLPERHRLVCWHGRRLYNWHIHANLYPAEGMDNETKAEITFSQGRWRLTSHQRGHVVDPAGELLGAGDSCDLEPGVQLLFSNGEVGRLAVVEMTS